MKRYLKLLVTFLQKEPARSLCALQWLPFALMFGLSLTKQPWSASSLSVSPPTPPPRQLFSISLILAPVQLKSTHPGSEGTVMCAELLKRILTANAFCDSAPVSPLLCRHFLGSVGLRLTHTHCGYNWKTLEVLNLDAHRKKWVYFWKKKTIFKVLPCLKWVEEKKKSKPRPKSPIFAYSPCWKSSLMKTKSRPE